MYHGDIFHKRFTHGGHAFSYQLDYLYLDLDEIEQVFAQSRFWSANAFNLVSFKRQDYLPGEHADLRQEVIQRINALSGELFSGKVFLLTTLRSLGYCMNPISLFYCFDGDELKYVLAEVHNTPWDERHVYLLSGPNFDAKTEKNFHVSPFMPMDTTYQWHIDDPNEQFNVGIDVSQNSQPLFTASIKLVRQVLSEGNVRYIIWCQMRQSLRTVSAIYLQAARLWIKRVPFYGHPNKKKLQESNE
ncbi:MAG: DUF1365 family protein [Candidatus Azotimanducaceae bacterium]